ncbi:H2O-forming NADH oxidase [Tannockella kyphosi]|uniref:H2O-forming NADH oxidase n=1 Tax=Tannockella kyphosi TaxID=2899121 RepID=UPI00201376BF|nr:FAD-dependent oxidoreductase [Tannockella kyphosi]
MTKIVVVGANHAGTACINTILDNHQGNEVVVFDKNSNISFLGCGMALWIGDQIDGSDGLFYSSPEALMGKGARVHMETGVDSIDFDKKIVYATSIDGTKYEESYDKVVLATGSLPIIPDVENGHLENIQKVKLFQHAKEVIEKLKADKDIKNVAVVGAGYIGVELVEAFQLNGKNVTLIDVQDTCLPTYYDQKFTDMMKEKMVEKGITLKFNQCVKGFEGDTKVTAIKTDKEVIPTDMVVWAVGFRPNNLVGKDHLELFKNGAYLVDLCQKTSNPDVYAIGDCATVKDNSIEAINYIALATNAVRSGIVAGHNIGGTPLESLGVQGSNAISVFGLNLISTGLTVAKAQAAGLDVLYTDYTDLQRAGFIRENYPVDIRIVFEKESRRIVGAQLASSQDVSMAIHMFSLAIQEGVTIDKLKLLDIFFLPHFNQPYNYITMAAITAPND